MNHAGHNIIKRHILKFTDNQKIELPINGKILFVGNYKGEPALYLLIDKDDTSRQHYEIFMPLTEQPFCYGLNWNYHGHIDIKNVTVHIFSKYIGVLSEEHKIENKKKRGRPKKYKELES